MAWFGQNQKRCGCKLSLTSEVENNSSGPSQQLREHSKLQRRESFLCCLRVETGDGAFPPNQGSYVTRRTRHELGHQVLQQTTNIRIVHHAGSKEEAYHHGSPEESP